MDNCIQACPYNTLDGCKVKVYNAICPITNTTTPVTEYRMTKADRIRAMSDEEMAEEIALGRMYATQELVRMVKQVESGKLVEVIRCKDCIGQSTWFKDAETGCEICGMSGMYPKGEFDFCSYGDRKEGSD